jgi:hypothetical protein
VYKGEVKYFVSHHPDEAGAYDQTPDSTTLMLIAARSGFSGKILFV